MKHERARTWGRLGCKECRFKIEVENDEEYITEFGGPQHSWQCEKFNKLVDVMNLYHRPRGLLIYDGEGRACWHFKEAVRNGRTTPPTQNAGRA